MIILNNYESTQPDGKYFSNRFFNLHVPQKNQQKKHRVPAHLETSKSFKRLHISKVRNRLQVFARQEFQTKKPKALRLLRLKPKVFFKRGSVLPAIFIKSLHQAGYVIYLDYGQEVRFYFFDGDGQSLGASTYALGERGLKELHGKAQTLLKLPK